MKSWDNGYLCGSLVTMGGIAIAEQWWWAGGTLFVAALGLMLFDLLHNRSPK